MSSSSRCLVETLSTVLNVKNYDPPNKSDNAPDNTDNPSKMHTISAPACDCGWRSSGSTIPT
eukprot:4428602-Pyramimonas_sp.AAC.2